MINKKNINNAIGLLPEYLKIENKYASSAKTELERLDPNSAVVAAGLIDKITSELPEFNSWSDYKDFSKEFRFSEVFSHLDKSVYNIKKSELLKGFFSFKGTLIDIKYLTKIAGYSLSIFEPSYYQQNKNPYRILNRDFWDEMQKLINNYDEADFNERIKKTLYSNLIVVDGETHLLINDHDKQKIINYDPLVVNNKYPDKVLNQSSYINKDGKRIFASESNTFLFTHYHGSYVQTEIIKNDLIFDKYKLSAEEQTALRHIIKLYKDVVNKTDDELNCQITAELYIDLDTAPKCNHVVDYNVEIPTEQGTDNKLQKNNPEYECFRTKPVLNLIRNMIIGRLSLCVYLNHLSIFFTMHSFAEIMKRLKDHNNIDLTRETFTHYERERATTPIENIDLMIEVKADEAADCGNWPIAVGAYTHYRVKNNKPDQVRGRIDKEVLAALDIHMERETYDTRTDHSYDEKRIDLVRETHDWMRNKEAIFVDKHLITNANPELIPGTSSQYHYEYDFSEIDLSIETSDNFKKGREYITGIGNPTEYSVDNNRPYKVRGEKFGQMFEEHLDKVERTKFYPINQFNGKTFIGSTIILNNDTQQYKMHIKNRALIEHNKLVLTALL